MKDAIRLFVVLALAAYVRDAVAKTVAEPYEPPANECVNYSSSIEATTSVSVARSDEADQQREADQIGAAGGEPRDFSISDKELKERQHDDWVGSIWAPLP